MLINARKLLMKPQMGQQTRTFWAYINRMFNLVDEDRRKKFGPDRTCAEWILRNGGAIKWLGTNELLSDYNALPLEGTTLYVQEVDASGSSIMHYGFDHFQGCKHINKIVLEKCSYLEDPALGMLSPINGTLRDLQVSHCGNISREGLLLLSNLSNLKTLKLFALSNVSNLPDVGKSLKSALPNCHVVVQ